MEPEWSVLTAVGCQLISSMSLEVVCHDLLLCACVNAKMYNYLAVKAEKIQGPGADAGLLRGEGKIVLIAHAQTFDHAASHDG